MQSYIDKKIQERQSPNTIHKHLVILNGALDDAVRMEIIPANPCEKVKLPRVKKYIGNAYTPEQATALINFAEGHPLQPAIILALYLGLRRSEILGLRWRDIDFASNTVYICNTIVPGKTLIEHEETKSPTSRRSLIMSDTLRTYLLLLKEQQEQDRKLCGKSYRDSDHVCRHKDGSPMLPDYLSRGIPKIMKKSGLPVIRLHDLRHTAGSLLLNGGANIKYIQEFLGHENVSTTLEIYTHSNSESALQIANILENVLKK